MVNLIIRSVVGKLVMVVLLLTLLPIAGIGLLTYHRGHAASEDQAFHMLSAIRDIQTRAVVDYLRDAVAAAEFLSRDDRVKRVLGRSNHSAGQKEQPAVEARGWPEGSEEKTYRDRARELFSDFLELYQREGYHDALVIRPDGEVIFSLEQLTDVGQDIKRSALHDTGLGQVWKKVTSTKKPALSDFSLYFGKPSAFVGVPVFESTSENFCGVLALRIGPERINQRVKLPDSAGKTAEAYLVGCSDGLLRSQSRFAGEPTVLKGEGNREAVALALAREVGTGTTKDSNGIRIMSAYRELGIKDAKELGGDFDWSLVAQINDKEAFRHADELAWEVLAVSLGIAFLVIITVTFLARGITKPIAGISDIVTKVGDGDLTIGVPERTRSDELGILQEAVRLMVEKLKEKVRALTDSANLLSASSSEISAAISQCVASTQLISTYLTNTTTMVEELMEATQLVSEKAEEVAYTSHEAVEVSNDGKKATEDTIERIDLIKQQMQSVGDAVIRLSEHSRAIENIIATVQDLTDQSNLLAVNASIEAAKAGDLGRGFSVVAHEIKSLADQSRQATKQIRAILEDTRKWVSAVVLETEQGGKAVEVGVQQSMKAGVSLTALFNAVEASSQAASMIQGSSALQSAGMNEVLNSVRSIRQASQQNVGGTEQLQDAAITLRGLGERIKGLMADYRV